MLVPINLTGGTHKSRSLPLSAQVTRNLYPEVQDNQSTKSPFVLQSFPGYAAFALSPLDLANSAVSATYNPALSGIEGLYVRSDGLKVYLAQSTGGASTIREYTLSDAYDITTATLTNSLVVTTQDNNTSGVTFNPDGLSMYVLGDANDAVFQYTLSTAWDVSTGVYASKSFSIPQTSPEGIAFKPDGAKMYIICGGGTDLVREHDLSTAWDVSTAVLLQSLDTSAQEGLSSGIDFSSDGKSMYTVGTNDDEILRYTLSTAWDVTTATLSESLSVAATDSTPSDIRILDNGYLYFTGTLNNDVYSINTRLPGTDRGTFEHKGVLYQVAGTNFYSVDSAGARTLLGTAGTITGSAQCIFTGLGDSVIITSEGNAYEWDGSTLAALSDPDLESPNGCATLNNQVIFDGTGARFVVAAAGDASDVPALNYATAETDADDLQRPYVIPGQSVVYLMGDKTIEQWWNSGTGTPPFDRVEGGTLSVGLKALYSVANNGDVMYFLGDDLRVWAVAGTSKKIISTIALSHAIENYATVTDAIGTYYTFQGQGFYQITFPTADKSWCFHEQSQLWFEVSSGESGGRAIFNHAVQCYNKILVADYSNSAIYHLDVNTYTENGAAIHRIRDTGPIHGGLFGKPGVWLEMNRLELICETGVGTLTDTPEIMLSWSDDGGRTFSTESWGTINIGTAGNYQKKVEWFCLGSFYERILRFRFTEAVRLSIHQAAAEIEVGI